MRDEDYIKRIEDYQARLQIALKAAKICVFEVDVPNQLYTFFENSEDIFGVPGDVILKDVQPFSKLPPDEYMAAASAYFAHPGDNEVIEKAFQCIFAGQSTTYEARMRAGGSAYIWCKLDVSPLVEDGITTKMIGVITDISRQKSRNKQLEIEARLDGFTGLYCKKYVLDLIRTALTNRTSQSYALAILDVDGMKKINDSFGHAEGDNAIKVVSDALKRTFRSGDIIGRFGGDEFILLVETDEDISWLEERLESLTHLHTGAHPFTLSIGTALCPKNGESFDRLFEKADTALYRSKQNPGSRTFYR